MKAQFRHFGISEDRVTWINYPNQSDQLPKGICKNQNLTKGQVAITYKHYLALKSIVEKKLEVTVVMEDNIEFLNNVPQKIEEYLSQLPSNWDLLFDSDFLGLKFIEYPLDSNKLVYKKSNQVSKQCHGSTKGCHFYLIKYDAAVRLLENFLPFDEVSDHYYNQLARKLNLEVFWAEPPNVHKINRKSSWL